MPHPGREAGFLQLGGSRPLQDSCGTSGLDHMRCAIIFLVIASLTGSCQSNPNPGWASQIPKPSTSPRKAGANHFGWYQIWGAGQRGLNCPAPAPESHLARVTCTPLGTAPHNPATIHTAARNVFSQGELRFCHSPAPEATAGSSQSFFVWCSVPTGS